MLTFVEELVLLNLDDTTGKFIGPSGSVLALPLAGALLMDLALRSRIDADLETLRVVDATPTGETLLDEALGQIVAENDTRDPNHWLQRFGADAVEIEAAALRRLIERGILEAKDKRIFWVLHQRRYPTIDGREEMEVKRRLLDVLLSDTVPSPRDAALISMVAACGLVSTILTAKEVARVSERIDALRNLDLIGHAMNEAIARLHAAIAAEQARAMNFHT